jgi:hypothetical protein
MLRSGAAFRGLWLDVDAPDRPGLRVEAAPPRMLRIVQGDAPVLLGWVEPGHWGAEVVRVGSFRSVIGPIRSDEARRRVVASTGPADWFARWCHVFADALAEIGPDGPLHTGAWTLRPARVGGWAMGLRADARVTAGERAGEVDPLVLDIDGEAATAAAETYVDWGSAGAADVLPLRPFRAIDAGRVKAHRKHVADGSLPPVLVWWVGGLTTPVVLDGHDRLAAALASGVAPPTIVLSGVRGPDDVRAGEEPRVVETLLDLAARGETSSPHARALAISVAAEQLATEERVRTLAWPIPDGEAGWVADAERHAPDWLAELRTAMADDPTETARLGG